jgi:hypothetical protein
MVNRSTLQPNAPAPRFAPRSRCIGGVALELAPLPPKCSACPHRAARLKPESDYRLFVRFKDDLSGHVQLNEEELTGILSPLREMTFT